METKNLYDCIRFENQNREQVMLDLIKSYYQEAYFDDDDENLYNLYDKADAAKVIELYSFSHYIELLNKANYVVAGRNLEFDQIICFKFGDNSIGKMFLDYYLYEIESCADDLKHRGITTEEISQRFPHIDFLKYFDEKAFCVVVTTIQNGELIEEKKCETLHKYKNLAMAQAKQLVHQQFYSFFDSDNNESIKIIKEEDSFALTIQPDNIRYIFSVIEVDIRDNN